MSYPQELSTGFKRCGKRPTLGAVFDKASTLQTHRGVRQGNSSEVLGAIGHPIV
jgi:hypothetical protein